MSLRIRRGLSTDIPTPLEGELLYTTDNGNLYVGFYDQAQDAVIPKLTSASLVDDSNPTLSANLDLGGNNIVGTGNINIDGTITATGNINLGDGAEDNVIVGGVISSSLIPESDGVYDLGSVSTSWREGFFEGVTIDGNLNAESIRVNSLLSTDSTEIYTSATDSLTVANIIGDLVGSVFGDDSNVLVDGVNQTLNTPELTIDTNSISSNLGSITFDDAIHPVAIVNSTDGSPGAFPYLTIRTSRGSVNSPNDLEAGDIVSGIAMRGYYDDAYKLTLLNLLSIIDADASLEDNIPKTFALLQTGGGGSKVNNYAFRNNGVITSAAFQASEFNTSTQSFQQFANASERDNALINPEPGMITYIADDGSQSSNPAVPKFQGFVGNPINDWVNLN